MTEGTLLCTHCGLEFSHITGLTDHICKGTGGILDLPLKETKILTTQEIRRVGAVQVEDIHDRAMQQFLAQQEQTYREASKEELVQALLDRDRTAATEGRQLADGRMGSRLLREFVRGVLSAADQPVRDQVERALQSMGAEPADKRQLKLHGHTLGDGLTSEDRRCDLERGGK